MWFVETSFQIKGPWKKCTEANKRQRETFGAICLLEDVINLLYEVSGLVNAESIKQHTTVVTGEFYGKSFWSVWTGL